MKKIVLLFASIVLLVNTVGAQGSKNQTITVNGIDFLMVFVEGGTFNMGSDKVNANEKPIHKVTLSSYYIGEFEVTQALWVAVMGENPSERKGDNLPVEKVSWDMCQTFIAKLNTLSGKKFRLPTESEWEFAAKGGSKSKNFSFSGSDEILDVARFGENSAKRTRWVGGLDPNELGVYDMSGNVNEWCSDFYGGYTKEPKTNPKGPASGTGRVCRGGSWLSDVITTRIWHRDTNNPSATYNSLGLRLVLVP